MQILAVKHSLPSQVVSNEDVINRIIASSREHLDTASLAAVQLGVEDFLEGAGTKVRYTLAPGERAHEVLFAAVTKALSAANTDPNDLDFIIYTGVGRGWLEPSMACAVQSAISAPRAACFDVQEACASWLRAMQIADGFFRAGFFQLGLIVNCECAYANLCPWEIRSLEDLRCSLAAFTIGEAATATVVRADNNAKVHFVTRSFGEHWHLCMIPLESAASHAPSALSAIGRPNFFYAESEKLILANLRLLLSHYKGDPLLCETEHDIYFSHAASERAGSIFRREAGIPGARWYCTHARFGNTVSASIPIALSCAIEEGRLKRGDRAMAIVGSAGISIGFMSFVF